MIGHEMWDTFRQARVCICDEWADLDGHDNGDHTLAEHLAAVTKREVIGERIERWMT